MAKHNQQNPYEVLGLSPNATIKEVTQAYQNLTELYENGFKTRYELDEATDAYEKLEADLTADIEFNRLGIPFECRLNDRIIKIGTRSKKAGEDNLPLIF